jgi:hypothetical protein
VYGELKAKPANDNTYELSAFDEGEVTVEASVVGYGFKANSELGFPLLVF